jgi:hypothetical protein
MSPLVSQSLQIQLTNTRNIVDAIGLIWFVVGNMWIFGDDRSSPSPISSLILSSNNCHSAGKSPIYSLAVAMLIINYIQICLPCIIAILLIPVFCFCMPCLIRILARMQVVQAPKVFHPSHLFHSSLSAGCDRRCYQHHPPHHCQRGDPGGGRQHLSDLLERYGARRASAPLALQTHLPLPGHHPFHCVLLYLPSATSVSTSGFV